MLRLILLLPLLSSISVGVLSNPVRVSAHAAPSTIITLTPIQKTAEMNVLLHIPFAELNPALDRAYDDASAPISLQQKVQQGTTVTTSDGTWSSTIQSVKVATGYLDLSLLFVAPHEKAYDTFTLAYSAVIDAVPTHTALVYLVHNGTSKQEGVIGHNFKNPHEPPALAINLSVGRNTFWGTFRLGADHFRFGYDHILFLITLLLVAPFVAVRKEWARNVSMKNSIKHAIILSLGFTAGHSLSLLIGSFLGVAAWSAYIEVLIAVTIIVSGIHALRPLAARAEFFIVSGFGLIHGLAFSSELFAAGVTLRERLIDTFAFNVGLEAFQLLVVVVALPLYLLALRFDKRSYTRYAVASIALIIAAYWSGSRIAAF